MFQAIDAAGKDSTISHVMTGVNPQGVQVTSFKVPGPEELDPLQNLAAREIVEKLLAQLAPTDRLVLTLLHLEGRSVEEVRELTGWNAPVIKVRAFRARRKLRKHFETLMAEKVGD